MPLAPLGRFQMQLIQLLKSPVTVAVLAVFHDLAIAEALGSISASRLRFYTLCAWAASRRMAQGCRMSL